MTDDRDDGASDGTNANRASDASAVGDDGVLTDGAGEIPADGADEVPADGGDEGPVDGADEVPADGADEVDFADLSLPQRVFVAAVQNPTRGVFVVALFAFAFSFYIAFWMAFPRVAAFLSAIAVVLTAVSLAVYYALRRL